MIRKKLLDPPLMRKGDRVLYEVEEVSIMVEIDSEPITCYEVRCSDGSTAMVRATSLRKLTPQG